MALVRISKALLDAVEVKLNVLVAKAYEVSVAPKNPKMDAACRDAMYAAAEVQVWSKASHLKDLMPEEWCVTANRVDVRVEEVSGEEFQISKKLVCPPGTSTYGYIDVKLRMKQLPTEFAALFAAFSAAKGEHITKYAKVRMQVMAFLKASKSLNDALKRFPDLALYIPQPYLDSVNAKVERSAAIAKEQAVEAVIDRDLLVSTGVVGKLQE